MSSPTVVVAGALANKPGNAGEAWVRLGWVRGFASLGLDVEFLEIADVPAGGEQVAWFDQATSWAGLTGRATLLDASGQTLSGHDAGRVRDLADGGAVLVDISGTVSDPALLLRFGRKVYVDLDPGYTQLWHAAGLLGDTLYRYDVHLTVGDGVTRGGLPSGGLHWHAIRPPVVLADWPRIPTQRNAPLTTVAAWRGGSGTVEYAGHTLGGKAREFRRLASLPREIPQPCEVALDIHPADVADQQRLEAGGWHVVTPPSSCEQLRDYIQHSGGEVSAAQEVYVGTACGWTSDRTACYLASGRPVVVQDTGFDHHLRTGAGLLSFRTPDEAAAACHELARDPDEHAEAARDLAERYFAADVVLPRVLDLVGGSG
jgi:hypothetical protein